MLQKIHILISKIYPNLHSVERLVVFRRDEAETIDMLAMIKILSQQVEH
jgi:hypothetical protein